MLEYICFKIKKKSLYRYIKSLYIHYLPSKHIYNSQTTHDSLAHSSLQKETNYRINNNEYISQTSCNTDNREKWKNTNTHLSKVTK